MSRGRRDDVDFTFSVRKQKSNVIKKRRIQDNPVDFNPPMLEAGLATMLSSNDNNQKLEATTIIRRFLSTTGENPDVDQVIQFGFIPYLVKFLQTNDFPQLQLEAAWAVTNIASGNSQHTQVLMDCHVLPKLSILFQSPTLEIREQAAWALANIVGDSTEFRDLALGQPVLVSLFALLKVNPRLSTWTLSNLCKGSPRPPHTRVAPMLRALLPFIESNDEEIARNVCWVLTYLSGGTEVEYQDVVKANVVPRLLELLDHPSPLVIYPAVVTVRNLVRHVNTWTAFDSVRQVVVHGGLPHLNNLLIGNYEAGIKTEACWIIAMITSGDYRLIESVIESNVMSAVINLARGGNYEIKRKALLAITNGISYGSSDSVRVLVNQGCIEPLCNNLLDKHLNGYCLEAIEDLLKGDHRTGGVYQRMIEDVGGLEKIIHLELEGNRERKRASFLLKTYWSHIRDTDDMPGEHFNHLYNFGGFHF